MSFRDESATGGVFRSFLIFLVVVLPAVAGFMIWSSRGSDDPAVADDEAVLQNECRAYVSWTGSVATKALADLAWVNALKENSAPPTSAELGYESDFRQYPGVEPPPGWSPCLEMLRRFSWPGDLGWTRPLEDGGRFVTGGRLDSVLSHWVSYVMGSVNGAASYGSSSIRLRTSHNSSEVPPSTEWYERLKDSCNVHFSATMDETVLKCVRDDVSQARVDYENIGEGLDALRVVFREIERTVMGISGG
ncbi:MAG: hypothetical protein OEM81_03080 [Acidimicrobiia bacterium]|nr:hypothetical protein [Acidimicrobiia bacterium]MDH3396797.1 hypothetical protein [Acidimicrobiia bacterium]